MIDVREYIKEILKERSIKQIELFNRMKDLGLIDKDSKREGLTRAINKKMTFTWARRIEIALDLPDYILINMTGIPKENDWKKVKRVGKNTIK